MELFVKGHGLVKGYNILVGALPTVYSLHHKITTLGHGGTPLVAHLEQATGQQVPPEVQDHIIKEYKDTRTPRYC